MCILQEEDIRNKVLKFPIKPSKIPEVFQSEHFWKLMKVQSIFPSRQLLAFEIKYRPEPLTLARILQCECELFFFAFLWLFKTCWQLLWTHRGMIWFNLMFWNTTQLLSVDQILIQLVWLSDTAILSMFGIFIIQIKLWTNLRCLLPTEPRNSNSKELFDESSQVQFNCRWWNWELWKLCSKACCEFSNMKRIFSYFNKPFSAKLVWF